MISLTNISLNEKGEALPYLEDNRLTKKVRVRKDIVDLSGHGRDGTKSVDDEEMEEAKKMDPMAFEDMDQGGTGKYGINPNDLWGPTRASFYDKLTNTKHSEWR